jgi:hypothetical protein
MTDRIDMLLKEAAPIDDETVRRLSLDGERELLEALIADGVAEPSPRHAQRARKSWRASFAPRRPRMAAYAVAAVAALALALVGVSLDNGGGVQAGPDRAWAAQALRVAHAVPRLALDAPGWKVVRADEFSTQGGELLYEDGQQAVELRWSPGREYRTLLAGTEASFPRLAEADVLGRPAVVFGADRVYSAVWRQGGYAFELRTEVSGSDGHGSMSPEEFAALVRSLRLVGVDAWLSAMPRSAVLPNARDATVDAMLTGLPLPAGFVAPAPKADGGVRDRYQLGTDVAGAVACGWIDQWVAARKAGDAAAERSAVAALASAREWPLLRELNAQGDYPEVVWELADGVANGGALPRGGTVEGTYVEGLGCDAG